MSAVIRNIFGGDIHILVELEKTDRVEERKDCDTDPK